MSRNPDNAELPQQLDCERWEAFLADKMDGTLAPESEAAFAEHSQRCPGCAGLLEQARQGQEWLRLLEAHTPAAPVDLLSRILARTQGAGREADYAVGTSVVAGGAGEPQSGRWGIPFLPAAQPGVFAARGAHNARLLMTAGMAFFSVALTLSVAGVRLNSVHAAELRPQAVQANVSRSFYGTKKQVVSFYENLRLVYEVESKMRDFRQSEAPAAQRPATQAPAPGGSKVVPQSAPSPAKPLHGSAGLAGPAGTIEHPAAPGSRRVESEEPVEHGWPLSVSCVQAPASSSASLSTRSKSACADVGTRMHAGALSMERNHV